MKTPNKLSLNLTAPWARSAIPAMPKNGMKGLTKLTKERSESPDAVIKSTDNAGRHQIMSDSIEAAENKSNVDKDGKTYTPDFPDLIATQDEVDRRNQANQAVIGSKEAAHDWVILQFGTAKTDPILKHPGTNTPKGIDGWILYRAVTILSDPGSDTQPKNKSRLDVRRNS